VGESLLAMGIRSRLPFPRRAATRGARMIGRPAAGGCGIRRGPPSESGRACPSRSWLIRELKGEPIVAAEEQIEEAHRERPRRFGDAGVSVAGGA
jgi:hypothetical protein